MCSAAAGGRGGGGGRVGGVRKLKQYGKEIRKEGVWTVWGIENSLVLG